MRRKQELRRAEATLRNFRRRARKLQALKDIEKERAIFEKLAVMGLASDKLEDILELKLEHILSRRLQTIVHKKGFANTIKHARQKIVHGHITISGRVVRWPGFLVSVAQESEIKSHSIEVVSNE